MDSETTQPDIKAALLDRLTQWANNLPPTSSTTYSTSIHAALQIQDAIGWDNFFEGCIAKNWEEIQQSYYTWCRSHKTG
jgi:hypothetical protein